MAVIRSGSSANTADVNAAGEQLVALTTDASLAGFVQIATDAGEAYRATENNYMATSLDSLIFFDQMDGTALNTNLWLTSVLNMILTQPGGVITLNPGGATTAAAYAILTSIRQVPMYSIEPIVVAINALVNTAPEANATMELGLGLAAGTAAPTDGVFFRWTTGGQFIAVISNGGTETTSAPLSAPSINHAHLFEITIVEDTVEFRIDDVKVAEVAVPVAQAFPVAAGHLPIFARVYNAGSVPATAPILSIGQVVVVQQVLNQNKLWKETLVSLGRGAYQSPVTAFGQTPNHANSASPASATLSNTAAGYTTMGGRFQFAAPAGAVTDFALFGFQVPVGFQLYVTSVAVNAMNTGVAVALAPTILDWAVGVNASAVSLATADGAGTWAPRRVPLGLMGFPVATLPGAAAVDINRQFDPPLVADSGRFLHVIVQVPVGTATASQVIRGDVVINGYFE